MKKGQSMWQAVRKLRGIYCVPQGPPNCWGFSPEERKLLRGARNHRVDKIGSGHCPGDPSKMPFKENDQNVESVPLKWGS